MEICEKNLWSQESTHKWLHRGFCTHLLLSASSSNENAFLDFVSAHRSLLPLVSFVKISPNRIRKRALEGFMKQHLFEEPEMEIARNWTLKKYFLEITDSDSVKNIIKAQAGKFFLFM